MISAMRAALKRFVRSASWRRLGMTDDADHVRPRSAHAAFNLIHGLVNGRHRLIGREAAMICAAERGASPFVDINRKSLRDARPFSGFRRSSVMPVPRLLALA
jgi:hypothetical protein